MTVLWWVWFVVASAAEPVVRLPSSEREIELSPTVAPAVEEAMVLLGGGKFEDAGRAFGALADAGGGADLRWLEAVAWYEAGEVRLAERAAKAGIAAPGGASHGPLHALLGLVLVDLGQGDHAANTLETAGRLARSVGDEPVVARVHVALALLALDRGDPAAARRELTLAREAGGDDAEISAAVVENLAVADALEGGMGVYDRAPAAAATDRRSVLRDTLDQAAAARSAGDLDRAGALLGQALVAARDGALLRETVLTLAEIGRIATLVGEHAVARDRLQEAVGMVAGTSLTVLETQVRLEAGRVAVRLGDFEEARAQVYAVRRAAAGLPVTLGDARVAELEAEIGVGAGEVDRAEASLQRAYDVYKRAEWWPDAARVATTGVRAWSGYDASKAAEWRALATTAFARGVDALGPAHVAMAEGLGKAARRDLEGALAAFAEAGAVAREAGSLRLVRIAEENAAQALLALGHTDGARSAGLEHAVARHEALVKGEAAYARARRAYDERAWADARGAFTEAVGVFEAVGESGYAGLARRGAAWSAYHAASAGGLSPTAAAALVGEAERVGDVELVARATALQASAAANAGQPGAAALFERAATKLESLGLEQLAAWSWADLAGISQALPSKVAFARRAAQLAPADPVVVHALYGAAVEAHNLGDPTLALQLVEEIGPHAGKLSDAVGEVRDAAREALDPS